jgi:microsomal dipeptidase-like Zn-dependent dipeptidase
MPSEPCTPEAELLRRHLVVEGHRDVYEQVHRLSLGEATPLNDSIVPRLVRDGIDLTVYAVGGDSYAHSQNTGRFLETTLENIDHFLQEMAQSKGRFSLVLDRDDLPREPRPDRLSVLLHLEGGKPMQGGIAQLRNFHRLGVRSIQPTWNGQHAPTAKRQGSPAAGLACSQPLRAGQQS